MAPIEWLIKYILNKLGLAGLAIFILTPIVIFLGVRHFLTSQFNIGPALLRFLSGGKGIHAQYLSSLEQLTDGLNAIFYKAHSGSRHSYKDIYTTFLAIALGYTVAIFFLSWAVTGDAKLGGTAIIVPEYSALARTIVSVGWALVGCGAWYAVYFTRQNADMKLPFLWRASLALLGAAFVFGSQYVSSASRAALIPGAWYYVLAVQGVLSGFAFWALFWNRKPLIGFAYVTGACYGLALGVPILIGFPLAVAFATPYAGSAPIFLSTILVPALMLSIYGFMPVDMQHGLLGNFAIAGVACLPMLFTIYWISVKDATRARAMLYSVISFLPFWIPISMSENQISHPVGFAIIIFWLLVPLLNAFWDSLSWWITYGLLNHLHKRLSHAAKAWDRGRTAMARGSIVLYNLVIITLHMLGNFITSSILFLAMYCTVIVGLIFVNRLASWLAPAYTVNIDELVASLNSPTSLEYGSWLKMLVVVTLFPAIVHLAALLFGIVAGFMSPSSVQSALQIVITRDTRYFNEVNRAISLLCWLFTSAALVIEAFVAAIIFSYSHFAAQYSLGDMMSSVAKKILLVRDLI